MSGLHSFGRIIITDLVPIFVIMILGYVSGRVHAFSNDNARSFNKFVLNYALPAALFLSIVKGTRDQLFSDWRIVVVSAVVIIGLYFWSFFSCKKFFHHTKAEAAISGLIGGAPTIGFLGFAVLTPIFGGNSTTALVIAIVAVVVNAIAIPIGLVLLDPEDTPTVAAGTEGSQDSTAKPAVTQASATTAAPAAAAAATATAAPAAAAAVPAKKKKSDNAFLNALKEPVVWAPVIAVIIVLCGGGGFKFWSSDIGPTLDLIAKANAGVAVFAAGLTLSAYKLQINFEVIYNSLVKLILMPALMLGLGLLLKMDPLKLQMLIIAGALPPVFSGIIIGSRYQTYVRTGTSSLAVSMILFMATAPLWIWICNIIATKG